KYVFDAGDVKGKVQATPNLELTKENAEWVFTNTLYISGYSRVPVGTPNTFQILRLRDAKDTALPMVEASKDNPPTLPKSWDMYILRYKATNPEAVEQISRMARNFMPPNSRILPSELDGSLLVTDAAPNLKKVYDIIKNLDQRPSAQLKKKWEE